MERPQCKHEMSIEEYDMIFTNQIDADIPLPFSPCFVLNQHEAFRTGLPSLSNNKKELVFFDSDHNEQMIRNRPVLLRSLTINPNNEDYINDSNRPLICLIEMKMNHVYKGKQLPLYTVTRPEPTNMIDGTIYLIVRDKFDFHIRLVISNWSYVTPTNEVKSPEDFSRILDDLLPINNIITLLDPVLTVCAIDGQFSLRCNAPNMNLILIERMKKCFVLDKLDELRDRGNQAYIHGDILLAIDYYSFAINRIISIAGMVISNENDCETNLFLNAFQRDLSRFHSNRSACYLRERLYADASLDSLVVVTGRFVGRNYDEFFLKCLYRLLCANIGLQEFTFALDGLFHLSRDASISPQLRFKFSMDFAQLQSSVSRWKEEHRDGKYDLKQMFSNESIDQTTLFDIQMFHANFKNDLYIQKGNNSIRATRVIPSGTLLIAQHAFACVKSGDNAERRLLNEIEKHLAMTPANTEFDLIRIMPWINKWFQNNNDSESCPKTIPWGVLVKTQQENPFRSKALVGWWPEASAFKLAADSKQKANCLWFICGKTLLLFNFVPVNKNDEIIIANNNDIRSFLEEHRKEFVFLFNTKTKVPLDDIFDKLKMTQCFFDE